HQLLLTTLPNYTFEKTEGNQVKFTSDIGEPETCWSFAFNHFFDFKSGKLKYVLLADTEEEE
ncbi:MAG: hypothetical protein V4543_05140, partial [Bacteroidota bacterium]